jgi:hypothetical protein
MSEPAYTITKESIIVVWEGKTHTIKSTMPNFAPLRKALIDGDYEAVPNHLTALKSLKEWTYGKYTLEGSTVMFAGAAIPEALNRRIVEMATAGESPVPVLKFWERLQKNPSYRSVQQLWSFMSHRNIPLTDDGCFLAYKGVRDDYKDKHSGTFDNSPGHSHEMPRNQISDDPNVACHDGFHVGALEYAREFAGGARIVVCKVDPEHVVCVPYDCSAQKIRVCKYTIIGNYGCALPSTTYNVTKAEAIDPAEDNDDDLDREGCACECGSAVADEGSPEEGAPAEKKSRGPKHKFDGYDTVKLLDQSIEDLRKYASHNLKVINAYKIPGGKLALVQCIMKTR